MAKSKAQNHLYKASIAIAYKLPKGTIFKYHDLVERINHQCDTSDQREAGRRFSYFVKHAPRVPFEIIGYKGASLLYRKTGPNPMGPKSNWKGGNN